MTSVAIVKWGDTGGLAAVIGDELSRLGCRTAHFRFDKPIPDGVDVVFSHAPYGRFLRVAGQVGALPTESRPKLVHWSTENPPDLRIPWPAMRSLCRLRSWAGRTKDSGGASQRRALRWRPFRPLVDRMLNFRYLGDYIYAHRQGWLDLLVESSQVYAQYFGRNGLPALFVPWGTWPGWYEDLGLERDIDVLWMGKRRNRRRSDLLDMVRDELTGRGLQMHVADNVENPFIFGAERTRLLNRAKITLNLQTAGYANILHFRFCMAAPNRSLVVSDPILPHSPAMEAGKHYVSASPDSLVETIVHYLINEGERQRIVENAYQLATRRLTLANSIKTIMDAVDELGQSVKDRSATPC